MFDQCVSPPLFSLFGLQHIIRQRLGIFFCSQCVILLKKLLIPYVDFADFHVVFASRLQVLDFFWSLGMIVLGVPRLTAAGVILPKVEIARLRV